MIKKILFIKPFNVRDRADDADWNGIENALSDIYRETYQVEVADFNDLAYLADGKKSKIWHAYKGYDIASFDLVVIRRVGDSLERAISIAHYLNGKSIRFIDTYLLTQGKGKLAGAFLRSAQGIPVPRTLSGTTEVFERLSNDTKQLSYPLILKADDGRKGKNNYFIKSQDELIKTLKSNPGICFVAQPFIDNDGDFRILVLNGIPRLAIRRMRSGDTHLNNTSQGGTAEVVPLKSITRKIRNDCVSAARTEQLQVAGADVIIDKETGKHYILEVNRAPQLATGAFTKEKLSAYSDMIEELVSNKNTVTFFTQPIGNVEDIIIADENSSLKARVDTGAKTSAIWASNITETEDGYLSYELFGTDSEFYTGKKYKTRDYTETVIASSNGIAEKRYKVKLRIKIAGRAIKGSFTLADRSTQVYPVLIGRNILRGKFVVDVKEGKVLREQEKLRTQSLRRIIDSPEKSKS